MAGTKSRCGVADASGGGGLPGPTGGLRPGLPRIIFRQLASAVERVVAPVRCAAGGGGAIARDLSDPRRRGPILIAQARVAGGIAGAVGGIGAGPPQRRIR